MRREIVQRGGALAYVEYLHEFEETNKPPDPKPRPLHGAYLLAQGYSCKSGIYTKVDIRIVYDGVYWQLNEYKIDTIEELEKLVKV